MDKNSRILISGAGVSGLACAMWLARGGMQPVIVEKAPSIRAGGYLVALSDTAYHFAEELDLMPALKKGDIGITASSYHDTTGKAILDLDYSNMFGKLDVIQMMRDDFVRILFEQVKDLAEFRYHDTIEKIEDRNGKSQVTFASGKEETFDAVIGCDGLHSSVRNAVFDPASYTRHYLGLCVAAFRLPNVLNIKRKFETHMEKDRYMAVFTTRDGDLGAVFVWADERKALPPREARRQFLLDAFEGTTPAIKAALEHCPQDEPFYIDVLSQVDMPTWHKGNSVLVGDAAHCLTLFSGRGAGAAFAGAGRLCKAMIDEELPAAFNTYDKQMRPVIEDIMPATRKAVKWYVPRSKTNYLMRDMVMRYTPNFVFRNYFRAKYSKV